MSEQTAVRIEYHGPGYFTQVQAADAGLALAELRCIRAELGEHDSDSGDKCRVVECDDVPETGAAEPETIESPVKPLEQAQAEKAAADEKKRIAKEKREAKKAEKLAKEKAEKEAAEQAETALAEEADTADEPEPVPEVTLDQVKRKLVGLGKERGMGVLAAFGASRLSDLKPEDYAEVIAKADAA